MGVLVGFKPINAYYTAKKQDILFQNWKNSESCQAEYGQKMTAVLNDLDTFAGKYNVDFTLGTEGFVLFRTKEDGNVILYMIEYRGPGRGFTELDLTPDLVKFQGKPFQNLPEEFQEFVIFNLENSLTQKIQCNRSSQSFHVLNDFLKDQGLGEQYNMKNDCTLDYTHADDSDFKEPECEWIQGKYTLPERVTL